MAKTTINLRSLIDKFQENCDRISEIADACANENRERTDAETEEFNALSRANEVLRMKMAAASADYNREVGNAAERATATLRENLSAGRRTRIQFVREYMMVEDVAKGGIIPVNVQEILKPLAEGLILSKVGLPFNTGLAGDYIWPCYEAIEATVQDEAVALTDTKFELSKLTATPQRVGVAMPVTNQTINQTDNLIVKIVNEVIPDGVARLLNKIMIGTEKVNNATTLVGPFVALKDSPVELSAEPTFKEFNIMKAKLLATGIDGANLCWVMTQYQKAIAEATPKDVGSGIMVCENDRIAGIPVFCSHYIGEGYIGLGDWRYQPTGLFGDIRLIVDPYSKARQDSVDFVLNADFGTTTLRPEAFALAKVADAGDDGDTGNDEP